MYLPTYTNNTKLYFSAGEAEQIFVAYILVCGRFAKGFLLYEDARIIVAPGSFFLHISSTDVASVFIDPLCSEISCTRTRDELTNQNEIINFTYIPPANNICDMIYQSIKHLCLRFSRFLKWGSKCRTKVCLDSHWIPFIGMIPSPSYSGVVWSCRGKDRKKPHVPVKSSLPSHHVAAFGIYQRVPQRTYFFMFGELLKPEQRCVWL